MRENRNAIYVLAIVDILTLSFSIMVTYVEEINVLFISPDFVVNCMMGIFTGAFLGMIIAIINYTVEKRREMTAYANYINCLNITIMPIYNLFKGGERNLEHEISIILIIYNYLLENLHMKPNKIYMLIPHTELEKKLDETIEMTTELYKKVLNVKMQIDKYKFGIIDVSKLEEIMNHFYLYLRNYDGDELFVNILTKKHEEFIKLSHLQYSHDGKTEI